MNVIKILFSDNEFMILTIHSILKVEVFHFIVVEIKILAMVLMCNTFLRTKNKRFMIRFNISVALAMMQQDKMSIPLRRGLARGFPADLEGRHSSQPPEW